MVRSLPVRTETEARLADVQINLLEIFQWREIVMSFEKVIMCALNFNSSVNPLKEPFLFSLFSVAYERDAMQNYERRRK